MTMVASGFRILLYACLMLGLLLLAQRGPDLSSWLAGDAGQSPYGSSSHRLPALTDQQRL